MRGEGKRSEADAHIGKSTNLVTFSNNKAKELQHVENGENTLPVKRFKCIACSSILVK